MILNIPVSSKKNNKKIQMSTVTGKVIFNSTSSATVSDPENIAIPNISVALLDSNNNGLIIETDSEGIFTFINVPSSLTKTPCIAKGIVTHWYFFIPP